jgi:hypothetical protein
MQKGFIKKHPPKTPGTGQVVKQAQSQAGKGQDGQRVRQV